MESIALVEGLIQYEVHELIEGRWEIITYPASKKYTLGLYQKKRENKPASEFRLVKVETIRTAIDDAYIF